MKKISKVIFSVFLLSLAVGIPLHADTEMDFSLKAALTFTRTWNNEIQNASLYSLETNYKMGYALGASINLKLSPYVTLQPEILYTQRQTKQTVTALGIQPSYLRGDYSMGYIEMPVLAKIYFRRNHEPLVPFIGLGPYLSLLVRDKYSVKAGSDEISFDEIQGLAKTDYGLTLALGLDINGPGSKFVFDYRLTLGLAPICLPTLPGLPDIEGKYLCHMFFLEIVL